METILPHQLESQKSFEKSTETVMGMELSYSVDGPVLLIDWSVISYKCWHGQKTSGYEKKTKSEKAEFSRLIFEYVTYLIERFQPSEVIFAVDDNPNWRVQYYRDYYIKNANIYYDEEENVYIYEWDFKIHRFKFHKAQEVWLKKKLTVAEIKDLVVDDVEAELGELKKKDYAPYIWDKFVKGISGYTKITDVAEKEKIMYTILFQHSPRYKKRDRSNWDFETTYEEFKELSKNLAFNCANTFKAKAIIAKGAEADDVIAAYVKGRAKTGKDVICVSVDQDLYQLVLKNILFKYFNPNVEDGKPSHRGGWVDMEPVKEKHNLYCKILAGDTSDTIYATFLKGARKLMSAADVDKLMLENDKPLEHAAKVVDREKLVHNINMVHLDKIPKYVYNNIVKAITNYKRPEITYTPEEFQIKEVEHMANMAVAREDRRKDTLHLG